MDSMHAFPTTQWTMLANATLNGDESGAAAMESLCKSYYQPVFKTICRDTPSEDAARDVTQTFLVFFVRHSLFKKADRLRGKFRTFLQTSLQKFLDDATRREDARRERSGMVMIPLEAEAEERVSQDDSGVALEFDHEWAMTLMENALLRVKKEYESEGRPEWYEKVKLYLPGNGGDRPPAYEETAAELKITSGNLRVEVHRLRKKFREALRREVARTVSAPHEIEEELQYLRQVLTGG